VLPFKHDWESIKKDYVEGVEGEDGLTFPTLINLSEKYNVPMSTLTKRSSMEDWQTERNIYRKKIEDARRDKQAEVMASRAANFDSEVLKIAEAGLKHVQGHFLAAHDAFRESNGRNPMPMNSLETLSRSLERFHRIGRLALGETTENVGGGGENNGEEFYIIQEVINDPELSERIRENFRQKIGTRSRKE